MVMVVATMSRRHKSMPAADILGILAFDAGKTLSRLVSLYNSLSDEEITKLRHEVIKSKGVAYLNSHQECFLFNLAAAERLEELDSAAATVSRLGRKCSDLGLARFDLVYADLKLGIIDLRKLQYGTRSAHKIIDKTEKLVSATASLHAAMETMAEMEVAEKKRQQRLAMGITANNNNNNHSLKPNVEYFNEKIAYQRKQVQHYKEASLWEQTFDKTVGIMARLICIIYARICSVFGPYCKNNKNYNFSGLDHCCLLEYRELYQTNRFLYEESSRVTKSGPLPKATKTGVIRFPNNPVPKAAKTGEIEKISSNYDKVLRLAPPSTVGGAGLSARDRKSVV